METRYPLEMDGYRYLNVGEQILNKDQVKYPECWFQCGLSVGFFVKTGEETRYRRKI